MRYPDEHKAEVRTKIVKAAAHALRQHGIAGVSIPALMKKAGLTHGGFYVHFADRDELVAEAARFAGAETEREVLAAKGGSVDQMLKAYLSLTHAQHPEEGCVLAALGVEGARQRGKLGTVFAQLARGFVRLVDRRLNGASSVARQPPSEAGLRLAAQMVGAIVLARMVDDPALAARILTAARQAPRRKPTG